MQPLPQNRANFRFKWGQSGHMHIIQPLNSFCFNTDRCHCKISFLKSNQNFSCGKLCSLTPILLVCTSKNYSFFLPLTNYLAFPNIAAVHSNPIICTKRLSCLWTWGWSKTSLLPATVPIIFWLDSSNCDPARKSKFIGGS